jgi:Flp pilus assembly protein TadD
LALGLAISAVLAPGQTQSPAPAPTAPPSTGGTSPGGTRTPTPLPTPQSTNPTQRTPQFELDRPIFLTGKVMLDDGTPPPINIVILRVCLGRSRPMAYTDSKGRFGMDLSRSTNVVPDASTNSLDSADPWTSQGASNRGGALGAGRVNEQRLSGCELQASLPGYRSDSVDLTGHRFLDNPDIGTIVLHRLANVEGSAISAISLRAPKDARKAYEKGFSASGKKKWGEAQAHFEQAVALYPQYAEAWYELGVAFHEQDKLEQARNAYTHALEADSKFLKPYRQMTAIAVRERKWEEANQITERLLRLDPIDFPDAYFFSSVANFNLGSLDAAEKSAREGLRLDSNHRIPRFEHLLGMILASKRDYAGAALIIRSYLQREPDARNADEVRKQLAEFDRLSGKAAAKVGPNP